MPLFKDKIFFGNPHAQYKSRRSKILGAIKHVCDKGPYVFGPAVENFEKEFAAWNGVQYCAGVGSGTDALVLALRAFGIGPGDEVITVSHTALATVAAIVLTGAKPVLVEVGAETATLDPSKLQAALTPKTKAVIPVHLYGQPCAMDEIMAFAKKNSLIVIEDCAQAHGATYKGKKVGSIGHAAAFSFYPTKNLGAIGDAGGVVTNDAAIHEKLKSLRQYGWNDQKIAHMTGALSRLDPLQAAILSVKLKDLDADTKKRRALAATYDKYIDWNKYSRPKTIANAEAAYHLYVITTPQRKKIMDALRGENVEAGIHYEHPAHKNPGYAPLVRIPAEGLPATEKLAASVMSLPMYPEFSAKAAQKIATYLNTL